MKKFFSYIAYLIVAGLWYLLSLLPFCVPISLRGGWCITVTE